MPDAFIWYHADQSRESELQQWMQKVEDQAGIKGDLYIRIDQEKSTFMETYHDVSRATIERIETLAAGHPVFDGIERRCESFIHII